MGAKTKVYAPEQIISPKIPDGLRKKMILFQVRSAI